MLYLAQSEGSFQAGRVVWIWILAGMGFHTSLTDYPTVLYRVWPLFTNWDVSIVSSITGRMAALLSGHNCYRNLYETDNGCCCLNAGSVWLTRGNLLFSLIPLSLLVKWVTFFQLQCNCFTASFSRGVFYFYFPLFHNGRRPQHLFLQSSGINTIGATSLSLQNSPCLSSAPKEF